MTCKIDRRDFMRTTGVLSVGIGLASRSRLWAAELAQGTPNAEKLGWRLGCESWTFRLFSLFEAIDKTASLGLHCLETGSGVKLSKEQPNVNFGEDSPAAVRGAVKKKLADSGVKLVSFAPAPLSQNVTRKTFDFAKDMGVEMVLAEPEEDTLDAIDRLCEEYGINFAIHNHPKPSHYWNPETVLKVCKGRSPRIGACADTGHWLRSGLNPTECIKKLEGRIISFHFKDLNRAGPDAYDVPWGTGACDVKGMLAEVHRQGIRAPFFVEYEYNCENNLPEIARSAACFDKVAAELAAGS
jgi:sugar phosphate isomerase/epimerase